MNTSLQTRLSVVSSLLAAALLAACATPPAEPPPPAPVVAAPAPAPAVVAPPPAPPAPPAVSPGAVALREGIAAFGTGEYKRSEAKLLESQKLGLNQTNEQVQAHKTKAFLYCVTRRTALCEKSFAEAFDADKSFDLTRAERGHPVWGPVFAKVQRAKAK
jgi:hypothetical protein